MKEKLKVLKDSGSITPFAEFAILEMIEKREKSLTIGPMTLDVKEFTFLNKLKAILGLDWEINISWEQDIYHDNTK